MDLCGTHVITFSVVLSLLLLHIFVYHFFWKLHIRVIAFFEKLYALVLLATNSIKSVCEINKQDKNHLYVKHFPSFLTLLRDNVDIHITFENHLCDLKVIQIKHLYSILSKTFDTCGKRIMGLQFSFFKYMHNLRGAWVA